MLQRDLIRKVRRIELVTRRLVNPQLAGQYHSVFKGRGMDFDEVHPYHAGDDVRFIDWNVTARADALYVKRFVEERELTVQVVVDASPSMAWGSQHETKRSLTIQIAAVLAVLATKNNDRVGLTIFDRGVGPYCPPKKGRKHVMRLISELERIQDRPTQPTTDLGDALRYVSRVTSRRAIVFVVSDFFASGWQEPMEVLARRHDVVPVLIGDPRERTFDALRDAAGSTAAPTAPTSLLARVAAWFKGGLIDLRDLETNEPAWVDPGAVGQLSAFERHVRDLELERSKRFAKLRLDTIELSTGFATDAELVGPLVTFFRRRARRS